MAFVGRFVDAWVGSLVGRIHVGRFISSYVGALVGSLIARLCDLQSRPTYYSTSVNAARRQGQRTYGHERHLLRRWLAQT